jgi:predicted enzyme related to lactoylglutathione lyase
MKKGKIIGIGGVMFRSEDPAKTREWYAQHLGLQSESYGAVFQWRNHENPDQEGATAWCTMPLNTPYFGNENQQFMINYIVENLTELLEEMASNGIAQVKPREDSEYGHFAWVQDLNGQQIELWEPAN